ncbi:hypothetical protein Tco_0559570 [Tanacetum coccineum]
MPLRKNKSLNEIHEQELEDRVMARMKERFDQLSDRMDQLMNRHDYTTEFYQLIVRNHIQETEDQLVSLYTGGLRVQIMDSVNMFDPMTLSDAYQRALAFEKLNRVFRVRSSNLPAIKRCFLVRVNVDLVLLPVS